MRTLTDQTIWEVPLQGGRTAKGTERELDQRFSGQDWRKIARRAQATRDTTYDKQLVEQEMDLQDNPRPGRLPTSARTYAPVPGGKTRIEDRPNYTVPRRASAIPTTNAPRYTDEEDRPRKQKQPRRWSVWFYVGIGMVCMCALFVAGLYIYPWWQDHQAFATYGYPRTWQCDAVVGHNDSPSNPSHFIFINLHGHPEVIEVPGGDETKQKTYLLPQLVTDGYDTIPITGEFADVNGDGKPDLIVNIQGQNLVFINTGTGFRPAQPGEHLTLPANLQPCH